MGARLRILTLLTIAALLAGAVWGRLAYWQVFRHVQLSAQAQAQYHEVVELPAVRGAVFDRNMTQLVVNTTVYSAFVSPDQVAPADRERVASGLSSVLGVDKAKTLQTLGSGSKFAYVLRRFAKAKSDQLRALKLPGVGLEEETQRSYLPGIASGSSLAANLLGFVTYDGQGQRGLEQYYQKQLAGTPGYISSYRDLANREIVLGTHTHQDPVNGSDLVLSLDANVQYQAEQALADGIKYAKAESGSVLIMDPTTGGIVAWADYPSYDANNFNDTGYVNVGGYRIYDWDRRNHGNISYTIVLEKSLNVGAIKGMQAEGHAAFYSYLKGFGLTQPSGIDVAGETYVPLPSQDKMSDSQYATTSFGQGIGVNMVQMLSAVNVVANGGKYAPPHVVERVGTSINPLLLAPQRQVITLATAQAMTAMMEAVVQHGSGYTSRVKGFALNQTAKTGTSQIPVNGQYTQDVWASFVGFLPANHPKFTMLVVVRKPHAPGSQDNWTLNDGYITAGPIWQKIAQAIVVDWRITPG